MNKILVIGDIILDGYVHSIVNRISPESPVPIADVQNIEFVPGGAANVAHNLHQLGASYELVAVIGVDEFTSKMVETTTFLNTFAILGSINNTVKIRVTTPQQQLLRVDRDNKKELENLEKEQYENAIRSRLLSNDFSILLISDYNKGLLSNSAIESFIKLARANNITVLVDTKKQNVSSFKGSYLITPNKLELSRMGKLALSDSIADNWLVTKGEETAVLYASHRNEIKEYSVHNYLSYPDVSGAGDTVIATVAAELQKGNSLDTAVKSSMVAAFVVCSKEGTSTCSLKELNKFKYLSKIYTSANVAEQHINRNKTTGFINGCFDVLHNGHLHLFSEAKKYCSTLVVAINSDEYITKSKGDNRPINSLENRLRNLASINAIDMVFSFTETTPKEILQILKPNYHFAGDDYTLQDLANLSNTPGIIIPKIPNISTTKVITT